MLTKRQNTFVKKDVKRDQSLEKKCNKTMNSFVYYNIFKTKDEHYTT